MAFFILPLLSARDLDIGPEGFITRHKLCFYYTCKFGVISIKYVIIDVILVNTLNKWIILVKSYFIDLEYSGMILVNILNHTMMGATVEKMENEAM